ncbi:MAG: PilZ domain-containing protein [Nitrospirota bacterium]|nr:PilZ domain-containing protein [Nitrospirota bacterium]
MEKKEKRYKSFNLDFTAVNGRMKFTSSVDIIDISIGGISIKIDRRLNIGSEYTLKIDAKDRLLSAKGVVVWASLLESRKSSNGDFVPIYAAGMEFKEVSEEKISELVSFIEAHAERKPDSVGVHSMSGLRLHMRFHVSSNGRTTLTCTDNYSVRKISTRGMFIETNNFLKVEEKLPMEISLPGNDKFSFLGRIVSCTALQNTQQEQYAIGIEFVNMPDEHLRQLNGFISMLPQQNKTFPNR